MKTIRKYYTHKDDTAKRMESRAGATVFLITKDGQQRTRQFICEAFSTPMARTIAKYLNSTLGR